MNADDPLPTRASLLHALKDPDNHARWDEFHRTYRGLLVGVARRSGLNEHEAEEAVQDTLLAVSQKMPEFRYDPAKDSFKGWLLQLTRWKIADQFRKRAGHAKRATLRLRHCTLVPGIARNVDGTATQPTAPSLIIESDSVTVEIDHSVVGGIRAHEDAVVRVTSSIVDATDPSNVAYAALDGLAAAGEVDIVTSTVIGKVHARVLRSVSNSILYARLAAADAWPFPVHADRRQEGCVRFSFIPLGSRTPRRYRCQPTSAADALRVQPQFTAEQYGSPAYCQLSNRGAVEIRSGADDESEMGAYHDLYAPQRETNLGIRLDEYLRFGLEAGVFHAS